MMSTVADSQCRKTARGVRSLYSGLCYVSIASLLIIGAVSVYRGISRQRCIDSLVMRGADVTLYYSKARYVSRPVQHIVGKDGEILLSLIRGRGQRVNGFHVADAPPFYLKLPIAIFGEKYFARVFAVCWLEAEISEDDTLLLCQCAHLSSIDVSGTNLSDSGLRNICEIKHLAQLDISDTAVSVEVIEEIVRCKELKELDIRSTAANETVVQRIRSAIPGCNVIW